MLQPYQSVAQCGNILLAASGPRIDTFNLNNGAFLSSWVCPAILIEDIASKNDIAESQHSSPHRDPTPISDAMGEPPAKKRRLTDPTEKVETAIPAIKSSKEQRSKTQQSTGISRTYPPAVTSLIPTKSGSHVIAVTGDDKSIRVLECLGDGSLVHLSQRTMPKRPCAIALTDDQSTIVCADKFGDVYSLPLLVDNSLILLERPAEITQLSVDPKPFVSAANHLTIHTARNRRALLNQMKQTQNKEKTEIAFEHELLLGHVSMLTDLLLVKNRGRNYIVTADRDEHIRISRGIPQTHVIEAFCLGHTDFVSRLCIPDTYHELLISGGGDDEICLWRWLSGDLLNRVDIRSHVEEVFSKLNLRMGMDVADEQPISAEQQKVAVSHICHVKGGQDTPGDFIAITCERTPALFFFSLNDGGNMVHFQTIPLDGNPLDIVTTSSTVVVVSLDFIHRPGSTSKYQSDLDIPAKALRTFRMQSTKWVEGMSDFEVQPLQGVISEEEKTYSLARLSSLLYNIENLRKRGGEE